MTTMTDQDKEWVKLIAKELCFEVTKSIISEHIQSCPHGRSLMNSKWLLVGICIGSGMTGGGIGALMAKLLLMG